MNSLAIVTLPNSGSTWLASTMAKHLLPGHGYAEEYFNPVRNRPRYTQLARCFGCELISQYPMIVTDGEPIIDEVIERTWKHDGFAFTKEVFSSYKLSAFRRHFDSCFVLLRSSEVTFPPIRPRIYSFYEHAWFALRDNRGATLKATDPWSRAIEAHAVMNADLREDAARLGIPVVEFDDLFFGGADKIEDLLLSVTRGYVIDARGAAESIVATRCWPKKVTT